MVTHGDLIIVDPFDENDKDYFYDNNQRDYYRNLAGEYGYKQGPCYISIRPKSSFRLMCVIPWSTLEKCKEYTDLILKRQRIIRERSEKYV